MVRTDSDKYMAPIYTPQIYWHCFAHPSSSSPLSSPVKIRALIDSGSNLVIIDCKLAQKLALQFHKLASPMEIDLVMGGGGRTVLKDWVLLSMSSLCLSWKLHSVCIIVAE